MKEYTIKEVSAMFNLPTSTLRYYEDMDILTNVGRTSSGQRFYLEMHINRLRTICCFKNTGMSISQLQAFFSYEEKGNENIEDILSLLTTHKESVALKIEALKNSYEHIIRKLHYYTDIKTSIDNDEAMPDWQDYKFRSYKSEIQ